jgi:ribosomal protein S20
MKNSHNNSHTNPGAWNFRDIPRDLMRRVKMAAAHEDKSVKDFLVELAQTRLDQLERKGILPKGKGPQIEGK